MSRDTGWEPLGTAFAEEAERYTQALRAAEELPAAIREGRDTAPYLQELVRQLHEVARVEQQIAGPKQQWLQSGGQSHPELETWRVRLEGFIRALLEQVRWAEREAALRQHQLAPELDALIRGQQMQRAYGVVHREGHGQRGERGA